MAFFGLDEPGVAEDMGSMAGSARRRSFRV
jgi:hypothetical protein